MKTYAAFLRGINVSGHKIIKMELLRAQFESMGFKNVSSYIQSGNVVFQSSLPNPAKVTAKIESELKKAHGFEVRTLIRTKEEIETILKNNPYKKAKIEGITKIYVTMLAEKPDLKKAKELDKYSMSDDEIKLIGSEIYILCRNGYNGIVLTNNFIEKNLKTTGTSRNWNTMNKVFEMAAKLNS